MACMQHCFKASQAPAAARCLSCPAAHNLHPAPQHPLPASAVTVVRKTYDARPKRRAFMYECVVARHRTMYSHVHTS